MDNAAKEGYLDAVKQEILLFKDLSGVLEKEKKLLVANTAAGLENVLKEKEGIVSAIAMHEGLKRESLIAMARSLNFDRYENIKLMDVLIAAGENDAREIENAVEGLVRMLEKVSGANAGNIRMVRNFMKLSGFTRDLVEKLSAPKQVTYSEDGGKQFVKDGGKKLDFKI
jgi:flagellar biosynthesis/type III secretory pathway chaperone